MTNRKQDYRDQDAPGEVFVKADSTMINPETMTLRQTFPMGRFGESEEKDSPSSLNSVNLIIYMIYKVTNKSIR